MLDIEILSGQFAICKLKPGTAALGPPGATFWSRTETRDEVTVVCPSDFQPPGATCETNWALLRVRGPLPFEITGIIASIATPLADAGVPVFVVSTFDTDYLLVKHVHLASARLALSQAGHRITG